MMQRSVIYQDIVQKEALKWARLVINRRFGEIDSSLMKRIDKLSAEQLEALGQALFDFSNVSDLQAYLDQENA